jgi:hypothetical protein
MASGGCCCFLGLCSCSSAAYNRETQAVFLLLTRRGEVAMVLFAVLFFPGVLLHEVSHYVMAQLLGVRTKRFSLIPKPLPDGVFSWATWRRARPTWCAIR